MFLIILKPIFYTKRLKSFAVDKNAIPGVHSKCRDCFSLFGHYWKVELRLILWKHVGKGSCFEMHLKVVILFI